MPTAPVLIDGQWRTSQGTSTFCGTNPQTGQPLPETFPISPWAECELALQAAARAFDQVRTWPGERFAAFLEAYAARLEARATELCETANRETALAIQPRLKDNELPRTINQIRQSAEAARSGSWLMPTIDTKTNIRSQFGAIGPVIVFGPNNFPFAYNGIAGGDFAGAVAAGNPVIGKGHTSHPHTSRLLAEEAQLAATETGMPAGFVQLIYRTSHEDGERLVAHPRTAAIGYTGSRSAGLKIKAAADKAGKPVYLELSSINPVVFLPHAVKERTTDLIDQFSASCLLGVGQFCTNPGLVLMVDCPEARTIVQSVAEKFAAAPSGTLLGPGVLKSLHDAIVTLTKHGAELVVGGDVVADRPCCHQNTLLKATAQQFLRDPEGFQTEAFGNSTLFVLAADEGELLAVINALEGNLTGSIYSSTAGADDALYNRLAPLLRTKVGRLLNDKMPTGVAVVPSMNHGGPYPATGHPVFTAVGIPANIYRFSMLQCYDNVRLDRLPPSLQNANPTGKMWRSIDGNWTQASIG